MSGLHSNSGREKWEAFLEDHFMAEEWSEERRKTRTPVCSFTCLFNKYLFRAYQVLGVLLGAGDIKSENRQKFLLSWSFHSKEGRQKINMTYLVVIRNKKRKAGKGIQ